MTTLTLLKAKRIAKAYGFTLVKLDGEYIVKPRGSNNDDSKAYFTNDLTDAVETARHMALTS